MLLRRVRDEKSEIDRFVEECWFRYHGDVVEAVPHHSLADDVDRAAVVDHHLDLLDAPAARLWVALEGVDDPPASLAATDATFAGFVRTSLEPTPPPFEWPPERVRVQDLWVAEPHRGTGLADQLVGRARRQARENGAERLDAVVATDDERAMAYFEGLGFETRNLELHVPADDIRLDRDRGDAMSGDGPSPQLRRVRAEDAAIGRFVEDAWVPFWRALEETDDTQRLSEDLDRDHVVEELRGTLDAPDRRAWVALEDVADPTAGLADVEATFAGWLGAGLATGERFLDPPERLFVGNLYVAPEHRGEGLADRIMERALQYAREEGCAEFALEVGVDNERARAYYEKLGFEPYEKRLSVDVEAVAL